MTDEREDFIGIQDENGHEMDLAIAAQFDMDEQSYALLKENDEAFLVRVETKGDEQYLVNVTDPTEKESILDAYEIAMEADPEDIEE
ncbi:DUF1292 domain-containing protein [Halobacillus seohaensis]|uniref:DUF1292 domain-containing protein n=1 Tax=Halobacillus seohaensis TaxID=447421 RepID=A0ABW2EGK6_9BACI